MSTDPNDEQLVTHGDLPELDEQNPNDVLSDLGHDEDGALFAAAAAELSGEDETADDLSTDDLIQDGTPIEALESSNRGRREYEADLADPGHEDTIEERMRQEEPEPGFDVVQPGPDTR